MKINMMMITTVVEMMIMIKQIKINMANGRWKLIVGRS
jgi:hypothetical protein